MDDSNNNFGCNNSGCGGFGSGGGFDPYPAYEPYEPLEPIYTPAPEPIPVEDFSIDPMAFVPGAALDCSRASWGASMAIQQSIEASLRASEYFNGVSISDFVDMPPEQQSALIEKLDEHLEANPIPEHFYFGCVTYEHRTDLNAKQIQFLRDKDALSAMRHHAEHLEFYRKYPVPERFYLSKEVYDKMPIPPHWKISMRNNDAQRAWEEYLEQNPEPAPAVKQVVPQSVTDEGQKVLHKKSAEGHPQSNLEVSPHAPNGGATSEYPKNLRGILRLTWDSLKEALK